MQKLSLKWSIVVLTLTVIFLIIFFRSFNLPSHSPYAVSALVVGAENLPTQSDVGVPVRLKIPKLNIDANVEQVGLASDGSIDVPKSPGDVAWFNMGPHPGDIGSSVIDGHSGYKDNLPAIFDNLSKLQKGDKIYVEDSKGETNTFVVSEFRTYGLNDDVSKVFSSNDGASHLNLITCSGAWNDKEQTHSTRLVVFADKELL